MLAAMQATVVIREAIMAHPASKIGPSQAT